jgi:hypothetical protein
MNVSRMMRSFIVLLAATSLVECSGGGASHSIPTSGVTSAHRAHAMGLGTISGCGEYPDGSVAVLEVRAGKIYFYDGPLSNSSTPTATISVPSAELGVNDTNGALTFDASGNLWAAVSVSGNAPAIYEFAAPLTTGESPSVTISGSNTGLISPQGISYNPTTGSIYVEDPDAFAIDVWSASASGNVAPNAVISGSNTGLSSGSTGAIKTDANYIYVVEGNELVQFNISASGNASTAETTSLSESGMWIDFDVVRNLYFAQGSAFYVFPPLNNYANDYIQYMSASFEHGVAVDDAGYVYGPSGPSGNDIYVYNPVNWSNTTPTLAANVDVGSDADLTSIALYSPGKFNGTEPQ